MKTPQFLSVAPSLYFSSAPAWTLYGLYGCSIMDHILLLLIFSSSPSDLGVSSAVSHTFLFPPPSSAFSAFLNTFFQLCWCAQPHLMVGPLEMAVSSHRGHIYIPVPTPNIFLRTPAALQTQYYASAFSRHFRVYGGK